MNRRTRWALGLLTLALLVAAGARLVKARQAKTAAAASAASAPVAPLSLTAGDVARAQRVALAAQLQVNGSLKAADSALVKAKVAAELQKLTVREGDRVSAGQLLGQLDDTEARLRVKQAEDNAAAARAQLDTAQRTLANNRALVGQGFISQTALDTAQNAVNGAQASLQAAQAAADLARKALKDTEVRAPIAGLVAQRLAQPGERVALDARLVEIVDLSRLELEAAVPPEDVLALRVGQSAQVQVDGLAAPLAATVQRISPTAQSGSRSVLTYLRLPAEAASLGLRQGLFARARVDLASAPALVVPASAVRVDQAKPTVLVVEAGVVRALAVTTGRRGQARLAGDAPAEEAVEVLSGVAEGATVLRGSVGALRAGTAVRLPAAPSASPAASAR
ncbi:MAG: efflux RND transporter periplasmic adaptor subunit [Rubrivivax sp.]